MDPLLHYLQLKAFGRGLRGYHTAWLVVGAAIWMIGRARNRQDVIFRTKLKPGDRLVIGSSLPGSPPPPGS